jgi:outer membrane protein
MLARKIVGIFLLAAMAAANTARASETAESPYSMEQGGKTALTLEEKGKVLMIDDVVRAALENHPSIKSAAEKVGAQQAVVRQQFAAYYPTLSLENGYGTSRSYKDVVAADTFSSQAKFSMTLYNFGKREGTVQSARETLDATRYNLKTTADGVVLSVKQAYYLYLQAIALVRVAEETVKDRELIVRQARAFYEVGTRPKIDVVRAESNLYTAQSGLITAQNNVKVAWVTLKNAMGLPDLPEQAVPAMTSALIESLAEAFTAARFPMSLEQSRVQAFSLRPDILSFDAQMRAQDQTIATNRRGHLPDILVDGVYGRKNVSSALPTFPLKDDWGVTLRLSIPIFDGFKTTYKVEESVRTYYSIKAQEEQQKQQVSLEVEQGYANLISSQEKIKASKAAEGAGKENLELANGRYQVGVGSIIEVTDAQEVYVRAEVDYINSLYNYKISEAQLLKAVGTP